MSHNLLNGEIIKGKHPVLIEEDLFLKVNELKYRRLIDNIDLGYLEVDNGGKVNYVNDAFCRMTKYEQSELLEQNPENILLPLPEQRSEMKQHNEARRQGIAEVYQLQIRLPQVSRYL